MIQVLSRKFQLPIKLTHVLGIKEAGVTIPSELHYHTIVHQTP